MQEQISPDGDYPLDLDDPAWRARLQDRLEAAGVHPEEIGRAMWRHECARIDAKRARDSARAERTAREESKRRARDSSDLPLVQHIGRRIAAERIYARRRQGDIARAIGVGQSAISDIERGRRAPTSVELIRIAEELGRALDVFGPPERS